MEIEVAREVAAPADVVWAVATDLDGSVAILRSVTAVERLDDGAVFGVGTRWRETRQVLGREATEEMAVVAVEPGRAYTVRSDQGRTTYTSVVAVAPTGERSSRLSMTFGAEPTGVVSRVLAATLGRAFVGTTRRALQADLDDLATAAERRAAG